MDETRLFIFHDLPSLRSFIYIWNLIYRRMDIDDFSRIQIFLLGKIRKEIHWLQLHNSTISNQV